MKKPLLETFRKIGGYRLNEVNLASDKDFRHAVQYIYDQASAGRNMTDDIVDEMGDFFDDVQASTDKNIKDAYSELRSYIDAEPEEQAEAAKILLDLLS